jgi:hypothetical protein
MNSANNPAFIIEMMREGAEATGRDQFTLDSNAWILLIEVASAFGWKPQGTRYLRKSAAHKADIDASDIALHDYLPGNHRDVKIIAAADAHAWATALSDARQSPHLSAMIEAQPGTVVLHHNDSSATTNVNAPFSVAMDEFIQFANLGAFTFAREK